MQRKAYKKEQEYTKKTNEYTIIPSNNTVHNLRKKGQLLPHHSSPIDTKANKRDIPDIHFYKAFKSEKACGYIFFRILQIVYTYEIIVYTLNQ